MAGRIWAALAAMACLVFAASPAEARWLRAESAKFIVYSDGSQDDLTQYVEKLEIFDYLLRFEHGLKLDEAPPRKLTIYLVRNRAEMLRTNPGLGPNIGGYYSATDGDIYAVAIREDSRETVSHAARDSEEGKENVVFHEYVHHFMLQYFPYSYPTWLVEGYAVYFSTTSINGTRIEVGHFSNGRAQNLLDLKWVPIRDVLGKRLDQLPEGEAHAMFYAESWLLTHYFIKDPQRFKQLKAYMQAVGAGQNPVDAMQKVTGKTPEDLEKALHDYVRGGLKYTAIEHKGGEAVKISVLALPPSADDILLEGQLVRRGLPAADRASYIADIKAKAARWPGDQMAELALARAEIDGGDRKAGEAILEKRLAADPNDVEALELAGRARLDDGDQFPDRIRELYIEATPYLAKAYKLDPNRYQTLRTYTRSRRLLDKDYPSDNTLEALLAALELAPQVDDIRVAAAQGMMRRNRWHIARQILAPLANSPHGGGGAAYARRLLEQIDEEEKTTPDAG